MVSDEVSPRVDEMSFHEFAVEFSGNPRTSRTPFTRSRAQSVALSLGDAADGFLIALRALLCHRHVVITSWTGYTTVRSTGNC